MRKKLNEVVKEVLADYDKRREERKRIESGWLLNMNFLIGNQNAQIMPDGKIIDKLRNYRWEERQVYNHIAPIVDSRLARFATLRSEVSVRPATSDICDVNAAKFSTMLLRSIQDESNLKKLMNEATYWSEVTGTGFFKVTWSDKKGLKISDEVSTGDIEIQVCSPFEIFPDSLSASDIDECRSIIHAKAYSAEQVKENWGAKVIGARSTVLDVSNVLHTIKAAPETKEGMVTVIEKYCVPTDAYPDGRLIIVAGDELIYDGILPFVNKAGEKRGMPFIRQISLNIPLSSKSPPVYGRQVVRLGSEQALEKKKNVI